MSFQWSRHMYAEARRKGKEVLYINLDESNIQAVQTNTYGTIKKLPRRGYRFMTPKIKATRQEALMTFTLVALICTDPEIQCILPQFIFVSEKHINWDEMQLLWDSLPNNVYLKRMKKGWTNRKQHLLIIRILGKILEPYLETFQAVLVFDALKIHLHPEVLEELFMWMFWYHVVPKDLTFLLQPLDTHAFRKLKRFLRERFNDNLTEGENVKYFVKMIQFVIESIHVVLEGEDWSAAFFENGYGSDPANQVSAYIKDKCQWGAAMPAIPWDRPSADLVKKCCWPYGMRFDEFYAFLPFPRERATPKALPAPAAVALPAAAAKASDIVMSPPKLLALPPPATKTASIPTAKKSSPSAPASDTTIVPKISDAIPAAHIAKSKAVGATTVATPPGPSGGIDGDPAGADGGADVTMAPPAVIGKASMVTKACDVGVAASKAASASKPMSSSSALLMKALAKGRATSSVESPALKKAKALSIALGPDEIKTLSEEERVKYKKDPAYAPGDPEEDD